MKKNTPDLLYCYPNSNVLKNKFNIRDEKSLDLIEENITFSKLLQINDIEKIFENGFDYDSLKELHKFIFGDIYDWAGQEREIAVNKGEEILGGLSVSYSYPAEIKKNANKCIKELHSVDWEKLILNEKAERFAKIIAKLWQAHPFREGNTRTVITFACEFSKKCGFPMNKELFAEYSGYTRDALVMASIGQYLEYQHLTKIFADSMEKGNNVHLKNYAEQQNQNDNSARETITISKGKYDALNKKYNDLVEAYNVLLKAGIQKEKVINTTNLILKEHPKLASDFKAAKAETLQRKVEKEKGGLNDKKSENKKSEHKTKSPKPKL